MLSLVFGRNFGYPIFLKAGLFLFALLVPVLLDGAGADASRTGPEAARQRIVEAYGKLPLHFEANQGQADPQVRFLSRGKDYALFLTPGGAVLSLRGTSAADDPEGKGGTSVLRMKLIGANPAPEVAGRDALPGTSNYFIGNAPEKWRTHVPHYAKVEYREAYPGVDVVFYGSQRRLEYDFIVRPGADPRAIRMTFEGADGIALDEDGDLVLSTRGGEVVQKAPVIYQEIDGERRRIEGRYVVVSPAGSPATVAFQVAAYDASKPLVIDPVLLYSTFLGGSGNDGLAGGASIAVDAEGNAYVTGVTYSSDFPTTAGAFDTSGSTDSQAFVAKINASGTALVYSTFLGGTRSDGIGIAVDVAGNAYVTGGASPDFPTTPGAFMAAMGGGFVAKLTPSGTALVYSTFLGAGSYGIAVDASGNAYVAGATNGSDALVTTQGAFQRVFGGGGLDAFVMKLNASGSALVYSTYLGGNGQEHAKGIAVDASGNAYVAGPTVAPSGSAANTFPTTPGAFQTEQRWQTDAFVTKLNASGSALLYSTYLGGGGQTGAWGIAVDASGNAYVTGSTLAGDFPTTAGAFQRVCRSCGGVASDAWVAKIDPSQSGAASLVYSTYLGGNSSDIPRGIAVDASGNAYVTGTTRSTDFPRENPCAACEANLGDWKAFVTKLSPEGSALAFSTYLTGSNFDQGGLGIAVDASGNAYVTGYTNSHDFAGTAESLIQPVYGGGQWDAFVAKIGDAQPNAAPVAVDDSFATDENVPLSVSAPGVLANDSDADGDTLTAILVSGPANGALSLNADGSFTYIPNPNFHGADSFTYKANDGALDSNIATVTITVNAVNTLDALVAAVQELELNPGVVNSLMSKLRAAEQSLAKGQQKAAHNQLNAFINEVTALKRGGRLDAETADALIARARALQNGLP